MTSVTFPLRPPRLAFAICGWRWQNDVREIKYYYYLFQAHLMGRSVIETGDLIYLL